MSVIVKKKRIRTSVVDFLETDLQDEKGAESEK